MNYPQAETAAQHIMMLAGEASGDAHAAEVARLLFKKIPDLRISGMGSHAMQAAGIELFFDSSSIAVVGIVEVLRHWGDISRAMKIVKAQLEQQKPDLLVLVDYQEFNFKMAQHAKSLGIKVLFYISPQVWAWRPKRVEKIGKIIDHMAVIFPFEVDFYQQAGIPVTYVGHPLTNKVQTTLGGAAKRQQLEIDETQQVVGLFPGSRNSEINRHLDLLLQTAVTLKKSDQDLQFILPIAKTLNADDIKQRCSTYPVSVQLTEDDFYDCIDACDAIITCSGTVTLEIALIGTPMCIIYKTSWLSYQIMSRMMTVDDIGLVNHVAGKRIVAEYLQDQASVSNLVNETQKLLNDQPYRQQQIESMKSIKQQLGDKNGSAELATLLETLLQEIPTKN